MLGCLLLQFNSSQADCCRKLSYRQREIPWVSCTHAVSCCPDAFSLLFNTTNSILKELSDNLSVTTVASLELEDPGSKLSLLKQ